MNKIIKKKRMALLVLFLCAVVLTTQADTTTDEFALFKRTISPAWDWGINGLLTVPKASALGKYNMYTAIMGQQAGTILGEQLYNTNLSLVLGTSDDSELGYTRKQLIWQNGDLTDLSADVFFMKVRVVDLFSSFIEGSVGVMGTSLSNNQFTDKNNILFNPNLTVTLNVPLLFSSRVSLTSSMEFLYAGGEETGLFFSLGADVSLLNDFISVIAEYQGINPAAAGGIIDNPGSANIQTADSVLAGAVLNVGAKVRLIKMVGIGLGLFNLSSSFTSGTINLDNSYFMAYVSVKVPLGEWIGK